MPRHNKQETRTKKQEPKTLLGSRSLVPGSSFIGIGIDLLSITRAQDLLRRHGRSFFNRILSPLEKKKNLVCSPLQLARYFTAKEAFFKSSSLAWTDLKGFSGMWIEKIKGSRFQMRCVNSRLVGEGTFFKLGNNFGAKVIAIKTPGASSELLASGVK